MFHFLQFAAVRAAMALFTLLTVSLIVFSLMELVPGTCAERYLAFKNTQGSGISVADIEAEERRLGLDRPFVVRWTSWVGNVFFKGEFGDSCILRLNINDLLGDKFLLSLGISLTALILAYLIAIPVGIISASSSSAVLNGSLRFVSYLGLAMPNFLLALMIMLISTVLFGDSLTGLFSNEYRDAEWSWARLGDFLSRAWLPVFILGWSATAFALQTVRALMLDENHKLYVTAARDCVFGFDDYHVRARGLGKIGLHWVNHGLSSHHRFSDAWVDQRQRDIGHEIHRHNGGGEQKNDRPGKLLVVRARQCLQQQCAGFCQGQDQRHDGQFVEHPVQIKSQAVDDWPKRVPRRIAPQQAAAIKPARARRGDV